MPKEKKVRRLNTLFRKMYDETVQKQVGTEEYIGQVKEFIINYANLYINKTSLKGDAIDVSIEDNRLKLSTNNQEFVDIGLNEDILNGNRNTNSKITKMNNIIEIAEDIGVELELKSLDLQNVKSDDVENRGFYISAKDKAPTTKDAIDYSLRRLPQEEEKLADFWIDDEDIISEYDIDNARRSTYLNIFESAINMETKTIKIDPNVKRELVNNFIEKSAQLNEASYIEEQEMLELNEEGLEINYSKPDILVLMHPEIIEKFNSLEDKYNKDGTLIEFDKLIELREHNINNILADNRYTEENKEEMIAGVKESFAGIMYEKLVNDHSATEVLDLRKRLGDEKFIEELDTIIETKGKIRDDNYNILKEFVDFSDTNMDKVLDGLDLDTKSSFKAFVETSRKDIEIREQEFVDMHKKLDFINDIKNSVEQTKGTVEKYTEEELEKADEERLLRNLNVVRIVGNLCTGIKNGAVKSISEWKKKREEQRAKNEKEVEIDFDFEDDKNSIDDEILNEDEKDIDEDVSHYDKNKDTTEKSDDVENKKQNKSDNNSIKKDTDFSKEKQVENEQPENNTYINNTYNITNHNLKEQDEPEKDVIGEVKEELGIVKPLPKVNEIEIDDIKDVQEEPYKKINISNDELPNEQIENNLDDGITNKNKDNKEVQNQVEVQNEVSDEDETLANNNLETKNESYENVSNDIDNEIQNKAQMLAEFVTREYEAYRAQEIERLDKKRMYYIDRAQNTVNKLYDNGSISLETAKRYLDNRQEEIDLKIGEEMAILDEKGSKLYNEVIETINIGKNIDNNLDQVYSQVTQKREELNITNEKIEDIETSGTIDELENTEKRMQEDEKKKEEEINGIS